MRRGGRNSLNLARTLRRNQTDVERTLWLALRDRRFTAAKFRRQMPVDGYVVDFACIAKRLVVELDGGQHATEITYDEQRTKVLNARGFRVLRFWNSEVTQNLAGVLNTIATALAAPSPFPLPLKGERAKRAH